MLKQTYSNQNGGAWIYSIEGAECKELHVFFWSFLVERIIDDVGKLVGISFAANSSSVRSFSWEGKAETGILGIGKMEWVVFECWPGRIEGTDGGGEREYSSGERRVILSESTSWWNESDKEDGRIEKSFREEGGECKRGEPCSLWGLGSVGNSVGDEGRIDKILPFSCVSSGLLQQWLIETASE